LQAGRSKAPGLLRNGGPASSSLLNNPSSIEVNSENIGFSDNYFDLLPGANKPVMFKSAKAIDEKDIKLLSLADTN